ncbi:hypothetical protein T484DRAFT_1812858, partial [Baffinella frigidus]
DKEAVERLKSLERHLELAGEAFSMERRAVAAQDDTRVKEAELVTALNFQMHQERQDAQAARMRCQVVEQEARELRASTERDAGELHRLSALEGELQRFGTAERRRGYLLPVNRSSQTVRWEQSEMCTQTVHVKPASMADNGAQTDYVLRGDRRVVELEEIESLDKAAAVAALGARATSLQRLFVRTALSARATSPQRLFARTAALSATSLPRLVARTGTLHTKL